MRYGSKVDFYGITPFSFNVYPDEGRVVFLFNDDDADDVYNKIKRYCDFEDVDLGLFDHFSYGNMEITTYFRDGSYVSIEIN